MDRTDILPGALVARIDAITKEACPKAVFEYDENSMLNIKADKVTRQKTCVFMEEITTSQIVVPRGSFPTRVTPISVYFLRFEPYGNTAYEGDTSRGQTASGKKIIARQAIRDGIEAEVVLPTIAAIKREFGKYVRNINFNLRYPATRFDANEVGIVLEISITQNVCLDDWKPLQR